MAKDHNQESETDKRLDVIIALINDIKHREQKASLKEKVAYFDRFKLSNGSIARILNISEKHVSKEKSLMKEKVQNG